MTYEDDDLIMTPDLNGENEFNSAFDSNSIAKF